MKSFFFYLIFLGCLSFSACETSEQTINNDVLLSEIEKINADISAGAFGETHSLLIYQDGAYLTENYWGEFDKTDPHYQYSVTKSVASTLIGIAIEEGFIDGVAVKLLDFFPEYQNIQNLDERKQAITLGDLLAMRAGFQWDEWTYSYNDLRNDAVKLIRSDDLVQYMLDLPMADPPGSRFIYNSGVSILLSAILQSATGMDTETFAENYLFSPLGITSWEWERGKDNLINTGWGLHLIPRDMVKIGRLFLNNGQWDGQQLLSPQWVSEATSNKGNNYGYQWWLNGNRGDFSARGWGGQFIFVLPAYDMIIVTTAGNFDNGSNPSGLQIYEQVVRALDSE